MFDFSRIPDIEPKKKSQTRCRSTTKLRSQNDSLQKLRQFIQGSPKQTRTKFSNIRKDLTQNAEHLQNRRIKQQKVIRKQAKQIQGVPYVQITQVVSDRHPAIASVIKKRQASGSRDRDRSQSRLKLFGQLIRAQRDSSVHKKAQRKALIKIQDKQNRTQNLIAKRQTRSKTKQQEGSLRMRKQQQSRFAGSPIRTRENYVIDCKNQINCVKKQESRRLDRPQTFKDLIKFHNMRSFGNLGKFGNIRF